MTFQAEDRRRQEEEARQREVEERKKREEEERQEEKRQREAELARDLIAEELAAMDEANGGEEEIAEVVAPVVPVAPTPVAEPDLDDEEDEILAMLNDAIEGKSEEPKVGSSYSIIFSFFFYLGLPYGPKKRPNLDKS